MIPTRNGPIRKCTFPKICTSSKVKNITASKIGTIFNSPKIGIK